MDFISNLWSIDPSDETYNNNESETNEHELFANIIKRAILDASIKQQATLNWEAIDFLFTDRVNPYVELFGLDAQQFKEGLLQEMRSYRSRISKRGDVNKRNFMINYERFHGKPFRSSVPRDVIYGAVFR
jgi:hypothetical protein